jgi:hypothetical protein
VRGHTFYDKIDAVVFDVFRNYFSGISLEKSQYPGRFWDAAAREFSGLFYAIFS